MAGAEVVELLVAVVLVKGWLRFAIMGMGLVGETNFGGAFVGATVELVIGAAVGLTAIIVDLVSPLCLAEIQIFIVCEIRINVSMPDLPFTNAIADA